MRSRLKEAIQARDVVTVHQLDYRTTKLRATSRLLVGHRLRRPEEQTHASCPTSSSSTGHTVRERENENKNTSNHKKYLLYNTAVRERSFSSIFFFF